MAARAQVQFPPGGLGIQLDQPPFGLQPQHDPAHRSGDMGQLDQNPGAVARGQEARQAGLDDDGVTHHQILSPMADPRRRPGHGHQLDGAVEVGRRKADPGLALGVQPQDAGVKGHQVLGRRRALQAHQAAIAAGTHHARRALHPVDELAVEVTDLHAQPPLAEIPGIRVRRGKAGQVEDAHIHRRQGDIGLLAGWQVGYRDLQIQGLTRRHRTQGRDRHLQPALPRGHPGPGQADGPPRHALGGQVHGPVEEGGDIGPGAPVGGHRELHGQALGGDLDLLHGQSAGRPGPAPGRYRGSGPRCAPAPCPPPDSPAYPERP